MSEKGTVLDENSVTLGNCHGARSNLPHNLRRITFNWVMWTLMPPLSSVVSLQIAVAQQSPGPPSLMFKSHPFRVCHPLPQINLNPHEWIPEETIALIAKHLPQEAANLMFLANRDLIIVLDCEFSKNELNWLPEFICGREIHFTS